MAKIGSILDGGQGKLGKLVMYKMNGKNIIRTKPEFFNDPMTPAQEAQRMRFKVTNEFLWRFSDAFRVTYASEAIGRNALHVAQSYNLRTAHAGEYPDIYVDKNKVLLSRGPLPLPVSASLSILPEGFMVQWENGPEMVDNASIDYLVVFILGSVGPCDYRITETRRSAGQYVWQSSSQNPIPDVWIAFRNRKMTQWSNSMLVKK